MILVSSSFSSHSSSGLCIGNCTLGWQEGTQTQTQEVGTKVGVRTWGAMGYIQCGRAGLGPQELREAGEDGWDQGGLKQGWKRCGQVCQEVPLWWAQPGGCDLGSLCGSIISRPHLSCDLLSGASCPGPLGVLPPELRPLGHALLSALPLCRHW